MTGMIEAAQAVLRANDKGGYTVPTARLYPFQWNWDSALVALGWVTFDPERAWRELERLLEGQWDDGMVPHIVFHVRSDDYFPGPDVWGTRHQPATSGISQPPVLATVLRQLWEETGDDNRAATLFPRVLAWHRWWAAARDPEGGGLVAILHPWESGMDNSPAWDAPLARVPATPTTPIRRRDTGHVDAAMRPHDEEYRRYIHLVDLFRGVGWQASAMWRCAPLKVADVAVNAILYRAEQDLLVLAQRFGEAAERAEIAERLERQRNALDRLWNGEAGLYQSLDLLGGERIPVCTSGGLLPLFARHPGPTRAARMAREIERWGQHVRYLVPSLCPSDPRFDPKRYWRGPVWAIINRMIAQGLEHYGEAALAARIREQTAELMWQSGFSEYYDPTDGGACGGSNFSWTAAMALCWAAR